MINRPLDASNSLALDARSLGDLKQAAKSDAPSALRGAATQFEAMFINMMMKSMRDATPKDGMFDSEQSKTFTSMLDQQMSQKLAKRGMGLADVLVRQLSQAAGAQATALAIGADGTTEAGGPAATSAMPMRELAAPRAAAPASGAITPAPGASTQAPHVRAFQEKLGAAADEASRSSGIPAKFMLGQAALETGWGKHEIKLADGSSSHNLFGIKAGPGWTGKVVKAVTTEYTDGVPHTKVEQFRAYDSYADSFRDYARLISTNPRYEPVMAKAGDASSFAKGLAQAGYATDPHYASKLTRIIKYSLVG